MKKLILISCLGFLMQFTAMAAKPDMKAIKALTEKTELLLDSATKHMLYFIVSKNTAEYDKAMDLVSQAKMHNAELANQVKGLKGATATSYQGDVKENEDEIAAFEAPNLKETVLNDKDKHEHVHFKGGHYDLGKTSKHLFDKFSMFLPAN
ncbi:MAG: hypothetical protein U0U66_10180 [Cytophagaceae bacterium]